MTPQPPLQHAKTCRLLGYKALGAQRGIGERICATGWAGLEEQINVSAKRVELRSLRKGTVNHCYLV